MKVSSALRRAFVAITLILACAAIASAQANLSIASPVTINVAPGSQATQSVTLSNVGNAALAYWSIARNATGDTSGNFPGSITVTPNAGVNLQPYSTVTVQFAVTAPAGTTTGSYTEFFLVSAQGASNPNQTLQVNIVVGATGSFNLSTSTLSFSPFDTAAKTFTVTSGSGTPVNVSAVSNAAWVTVSPSGGTATSSGTIFTVNAAAQTYDQTAIITVSSGTSDSKTVTVTWSATGTSSLLTASATSITLSAQSGGSSVMGALTIGSLTGSVVNFTAVPSSGTGWLSVSPTIGATSTGANTLTITANPLGLPANTTPYSGTIIVTPTSPAGTAMQIPVYFTVTSGSGLTLSQSNILFSSTDGTTFSPLPQQINVTSTYGAVTSFTVSKDQNWLLINPTAGTTPGSFWVSVDPPSAPNNTTTTGTVTVTGGGGQATLTVRLAKGVQAISANPTALSISAVTGGTATGQFTVSSTGPDSIYVSAQQGTSWLSVTTPTGPYASISSTNPVVVTVTANSAFIGTSGTFTGNIIVQTNYSGNVTIPVTFTVGSTGGTGGLTASPTTVTLTSSAPTSYVTLYGTTGQYYYASPYSTTSWFSISPSSGTLPGTIAVTGTPYLCGTTTCTGSISVTTSAGGTLTIPVYMNYSGTGTGALSVSPTTVAFTGTATSGIQTSSVSVFGTTSTTYSATSSVQTPVGGSWLTVVPTGYITPGTITLQANPTGLSAGTYSATVTVYSSIGTATIPVTLTVTGAGGTLTATPTSISFTTPVGTNPANQTLTISSSTGVAVPFTASPNSNSGWLTVTPTSSSTGSALTVSANVSGLTAGIYLGSIAIDTGSTTLSVPVSLNLGGTGGTLSVSPNPISFSLASDSGVNCQSVSVAGSASEVTFLTQISTGSGNWLSVPTQGLTGHTIQVCVQPSAAVAGTNTATIAFSSTVGSATATVTLTVGTTGGTGTSGITPSPSSLTLSGTPYTGTPAYATLLLTSTTGATFTITPTTTTGQSWLSVTPTTGSAAITGTTLTVIANPSAVGIGSYTGYLTILNTLTGGTTVVPVTFNVGTTGTGVYTVSPTSLTFSTSGGATPSPQTLYVSNSTGLTEVVYATPSVSWLTLSQNYLTLPSAVLTVNVNPASLATGTNTGYINLTNTSGVTQQTIPVTVTVTSAGLSFSPAAVSLTAPQGGTSPRQTVSVSSATGVQQSVFPTATTTSGGSWLNITPSSGSTPANFDVSANAAGLSQGTYTGNISFSNGITTQNLAVTLTVTAPVTLTASPANLTFTANQGASAPAAQNISVSTSGSNIGYTAAATTETGGNWLTISPSAGTTPGTVAVTANPSGLNPGEYIGKVTITASGAQNSPQTVQVKFTVVATAPQISSVSNAASGTTGLGAFSAGTIITVKGRNLGPQTGQTAQVSNNMLPTEISQVRVLVGGVPAPLLYVQDGQINFIAPFGIAGSASTPIVVEYRGQRSSATTITLTDASPGIFTADASGTGPGAILNQNFSLNTSNNAAEAGSIVSAFGTGFGLLQPIPADGAVVTGSNLPQPTLPVSALIGNTEAKVTYAGQAPGMVAGGIQVNIEVPANLAPGVYPLTIRVGRFSSQVGVTVAVR